LLADFEPKGAVARAFGHYLAEAGITDRATVIIDKSGVVRYSVSVTPSGQRDIAELAAICEEINGGAGSDVPSHEVPSGTELFVKSNCGHSRAALLAVDNLRLRDEIAIHNVTDDATAAARLEKEGGKNQAPCLIFAGTPLYEATDIIARLAQCVAPV